MILFGSETPDPDVDFFHIISWHCEIKADYPDVLLNSECCCETEARCLEFCLNATLNFGPKDFDRSQLRPKSTQQGNDATPSSSSPGFPAVALAPFPTPCRLAAPRRTAHSSRSGGGTGGGRSRGCLTGVPRPAGPVGGKIVTTRQILTERGTAHLRSSSPFRSNRSPPFADRLKPAGLRIDCIPAAIHQASGLCSDLHSERPPAPICLPAGHLQAKVMPLLLSVSLPPLSLLLRVDFA